jgi:hypothetical protein
MKERPIKFKAEGVRAILAGMKTETRRVIKPAPRLTPSGLWTWKHKLYGTIRHENGGVSPIDEWSELCPRGQVGDRLWVQETWTLCTDDGGTYKTIPKERPTHIGIFYRADGHDLSLWQPSSRMPRWASRITLKITAIRVQRVQEITQEEALTEGVDLSRELYPEENAPDKARFLFPKLWDSIYDKSGYGWKNNPFVWAITFKRVKQDGGV